MTTTNGTFDELRLARAYLLAVAEPPAPALAAFVDANGPVVVAKRVREQEVPAQVAAATKARVDYDPSVDIERAAEQGARLIIPEDPEWPHWAMLALRGTTNVPGVAPPLALWARGTARLDVALRSSVSVAGTRATSPYGEFAAADTAYSFANERVTVVSRANYGVDAAAIRGALANEGTAVAVLACALDAGYPAGHEALLDRIAERGLVLSEYPPGTPVAKHRFQAQCRLIAALGQSTFLVEAGLGSAAVALARTTFALGKPVFALPGPVTARTSDGCHELIRERVATLVTTAEHVLESIQRPRRPTKPGA